MEKIAETRPLRWPDADLQPLWPKLRIRTAYDDINANHENSRNRNDQSRCRPGQSVCDPAERSSRHRGPLPKWQDRSVVLAAGTEGCGIHTERYGSRCRSIAEVLSSGDQKRARDYDGFVPIADILRRS